MGGYAVAFHAKPRFTKDIDLLVEPNPDNAQRLLRAAVPVFYIGKAELVRNKRAAGRAQDLADVEALE